MFNNGSLKKLIEFYTMNGIILPIRYSDGNFSNSPTLHGSVYSYSENETFTFDSN